MNRSREATIIVKVTTEDSLRAIQATYADLD